MAPGLSPADRGWVHQAAFGTVRLRGRLDHLLDLHLHRGVRSVPPPLLRLLRLGAYQLLHMDSVPGYAAVSQTVEQARVSGGRRGAGLVNAVLRALAEAGGGPERFPAFDDDPVGHLSTWGSHPRWLVERWVRRLGPEAARRVVEAGNRIPGLHVRPVGIRTADALVHLREEGIGAEPGPEGSGTLRLPPGTDPVRVLALVPAVVQDPAASRVVEHLPAVEGLLVADLCAAPGGKGIGLAGRGARVVAADASPVRLARMGEALERLGLRVPRVVARAERPPFASVDAVLLDVPCTGTGTLARHPDARWRLRREDPGAMGRVQGEILAGAAGIVRTGGRLLYATCTLEPEENEDRVEAFLGTHRDYILDGEDAILGILPGVEGGEGTDGAFAARFRRKG